jgi:hypothetical protein
VGIPLIIEKPINMTEYVIFARTGKKLVGEDSSVFHGTIKSNKSLPKTTRSKRSSIMSKELSFGILKTKYPLLDEIGYNYENNNIILYNFRNISTTFAFEEIDD